LDIVQKIGPLSENSSPPGLPSWSWACFPVEFSETGLRTWPFCGQIVRIDCLQKLYAKRHARERLLCNVGCPPYSKYE